MTFDDDTVAVEFLLTPLREGRRKAFGVIPRDWYFYSRPCGRGDGRRRRKILHDRISTHAPAGGATQQEMVALPSSLISTHAPAGGAT